MKYSVRNIKKSVTVLLAILLMSYNSTIVIAESRLPEEEVAAKELKEALDITEDSTAGNTGSYIRNTEEEKAYTELLSVLNYEGSDAAKKSTIEDANTKPSSAPSSRDKEEEKAYTELLVILNHENFNATVKTEEKTNISTSIIAEPYEGTISKTVRDAEEEKAYMELLAFLVPEGDNATPDYIMEKLAREQLQSVLETASTTIPDNTAQEAESEPTETSIAESVPVETTAEVPANYTVTPASDVHWADNFEMEWTFGKDEDGEIHHMYVYEIYNADTNERLNRSGGQMSSNGTNVTLGISSSIVNKMISGNYYFEVYAVDNSKKNKLSESVRSDTKSYTKPTSSLPVPENLRWEGTNMCFDYPKTDSEEMHFQLYYCKKEDGDYLKVHESTLRYKKSIDMLKYKVENEGYYKFRVDIYSKGIQKMLPSGYSEFSEAMYYSGK